MHSDVHHLLHHLRATELAAGARAAESAAEVRAAHPPEHRMRTQVGWMLVELGLRMAQQTPRGQARLA
ncbi:hypothetical protein ABZX93_19705 [Streptomyces sp. NPDC006632]|uniref:hypothetical protein n=1 Tax=unclassified Streptomyces TaxID=2593676 RepID=UPI002E20302A